MANSISRSGDKPGISLNTSENSRTMGISLGYNSGIFAASPAHLYVVQPFPTNLWALVAEINGMEWYG